MSALQQAIERLERATWDTRSMPSKADVRLLLDGFAEFSAVMRAELEDVNLDAHWADGSDLQRLISRRERIEAVILPVPA